MLIVLLTVGGFGLAKSKPADDEVSLSEPLVWADVQRQFERVDRLTSGRRYGPDQPMQPDEEQIPKGEAPNP
jgi:hypothetical protein